MQCRTRMQNIVFFITCPFRGYLILDSKTWDFQIQIILIQTKLFETRSQGFLVQGCYLSINHKMSRLWNDQLDLHVIWWFLVLCGAGLKESSRMSHADSALLAEIMDEARRQVGVVYSQDSQWAFSCSYHHLYNRSIKVSGAPTAALLYWFNHKIKSQLLFCRHRVFLFSLISSAYEIRSFSPISL